MRCEPFWCVEAYRGGTGMAVALPSHSRRVNAKVHVYKVSSLILYTFEYNENYYKGSHFQSCIFSGLILTSYRLSGVHSNACGTAIIGKIVSSNLIARRHQTPDFIVVICAACTSGIKVPGCRTEKRN